MTNSSSLLLDGGSFSIVEGGSFAGEGLLDPIQPGEKRLISYAADLAMQVVAKPEGVPQKVTNVRIARGIMVRTIESRQRVIYTVRNDDTATRALILEHPVRTGWKLSASTTAKPEEESATAYRFRIEVPSKETKTFTVEESNADTAQFALTSLNLNVVEAFVKSDTLTPEMEQAMRQILAQKDEIAKLDADLKSKESAITDIVQDQDRLRENLKSLKGTPEEKTLAQRYTGELNDQENQLAALRKEHAELQTRRKQAQQELDSTIENLNIGVAPK
jgi:chromosome segregation ATPase